jgi:hypothetical protein
MGCPAHLPVGRRVNPIPIEEVITRFQITSKAIAIISDTGVFRIPPVSFVFTPNT